MAVSGLDPKTIGYRPDQDHLAMAEVCLDWSSVKGTPFTSRNPIAISSRPIFGLNHFGSYMHKL